MGVLMGPPSTSIESQSLRSIDSRTQPFVNKDYVKNISWLNYSVDTLSQYTQMLQAGVDDANQDFIGQITGLISDIFITLAGLEPNGVELGDLKYIFQGLGALFGIDTDTPFPMNLATSAEHLLSNFIAPLPQFTDIIFESVEAWAIAAGLSTEFIDALEDLEASLLDLNEEFSTDIAGLFSGLGTLLGVFGGSEGGGASIDLSGLRDFWELILSLIDGLNATILRPMFVKFADLGIPFITSLSTLLRASTTVLGILSGDQIGEYGSNFCPTTSNDTDTWVVGSNPATQWVFDGTNDSGDGGSFKTTGNSTAKRILTQESFPCDLNQTFNLSGSMKWSSVPTGSNDFGLCLVFYLSGTEDSQVDLPVSGGHGASGGFTSLGDLDIDVPINVDNFKIGMYIDTGITSGTVWGGDVSVRRHGFIHQTFVQNLVSDLSDLTSDVLDALGKLGTLITNTGHAVIEDVAEDINDSLAGALDAVGRLNTLISTAAVANITAVGTKLNTATTNAQSALTQLGTVITNLGGSVAADIATAINAAGSNATSALGQLGTLVTNTSQSTIAGVATFINSSDDNIHDFIDAWNNFLSNGSSVNTLVSDFQTKAQQALSGFLPAWFNNGNGTATPVAAVTNNGNGTGTFDTSLITNPVHTFLNNLNGTGMSIMTGLHNLIFGASQADNGPSQQLMVPQTVVDATSGMGSAANSITPAVNAANIAISLQGNSASSFAPLSLYTGYTVGGGNTYSVSFADYPNADSLPSVFTRIFGTETISINNGFAIADTSPTDLEMYYYNAGVTATDFQIITGVWAAVFSDTNTDYAQGHGKGGPILVGRWDGGSGPGAVLAMYFDLGPDSVYGNFSGWALTYNGFNSICYFLDDFTPFAEYSLVCGWGNGQRKFAFVKNNAPLTPTKNIFGGSGTISGNSVIDTSSSTHLGSPYVGGGFGYSGCRFSMVSWLMSDYVPTTLQTFMGDVYSNAGPINENIVLPASSSFRVLESLDVSSGQLEIPGDSSIEIVDVPDVSANIFKRQGIATSKIRGLGISSGAYATVVGSPTVSVLIGRSGQCRVGYYMQATPNAGSGRLCAMTIGATGAKTIVPGAITADDYEIYVNNGAAGGGFGGGVGAVDVLEGCSPGSILTIIAYFANTSGGTVTFGMTKLWAEPV